MFMEGNVKILIVIRSYNEEKFISRCINDILNQKCRFVFKVVVVDSGSTDNTVEMVKAFKQVNLIQIPKDKFTYGRALNIGFESEPFDIGVAISAHCLPTNEHWLSNLVSPLLNDSEVALSFGSQIGLESLSRTSELIYFKENYRQILQPENYKAHNLLFNNAKSAPSSVSLTQSLGVIFSSELI